MIMDGKELIKKIREEHPNRWISLKLACDYINKYYILVDINEFEPITDINTYQAIVSDECIMHKSDCPHTKFEDPHVSGCICCLCDAINRRDDLVISKKED